MSELFWKPAPGFSGAGFFMKKFHGGRTALKCHNENRRGMNAVAHYAVKFIRFVKDHLPLTEMMNRFATAQIQLPAIHVNEFPEIVRFPLCAVIRRKIAIVQCNDTADVQNIFQRNLNVCHKLSLSN